MFNLCQSVKVYNIEKHYHLYEESNRQQNQSINLLYTKLKPGSISLTTSINSKNCAKPIFQNKKGLLLSKQINTRQIMGQQATTKPMSSTIYRDRRQSAITDYPAESYHQLDNVELAKLSQFKDQFQSRKIKRQNSLIDRIQNRKSRQQNSKQSRQTKQVQKINIKNKPQINKSQKQINKQLIFQLFSTDKQKSINNSKIMNRNKINIINKIDIHQLTTSRNFNDKNGSQYDRNSMASKMEDSSRKSQTASEKYTYSQQQQYSRKYNNYRYCKQQSMSNISASANNSYNNKQQIKPNQQNSQRIYLKVMQASRGQARQASIMLSNILSRNSEPDCCYDSQYKPSLSVASKPNKKHKFNLWHDQDKQTIFSCENDDKDDCSIKYEQSQIYDMDPRNNFVVIKNKSINNSVYNVSLAIQLKIWCLVSLKEIGFRQMSLISQQLQMYEFVEQNFKNSQIYKNILQLYQVQMSKGSYILIKEPYTQNLVQFMASLETQQKIKHEISITESINYIFAQFSKFMMYPTRKLTPSDFVVCEEEMKIHDLSLFRQMNQPIFSIQELKQGIFNSLY